MVLGKAKITGHKKREIKINKYTFEKVDNFKYLGIIINENNKKEFEIQERLKNANKAYFMLQNILKSKNIKIHIKNSVINKILSYGSEAWSLTKKERSQLNVFERKIYRRIFGPVFDNKTNEWRILSNEELDKKSKGPNIMETIKINGLRWFGHVTWMSDNRLPKKLFVWEGPHTKRPRGRPRNRWKDKVYKDAERLDKNWKGAINNRDSWRRLLRTARNRRIL